MSDTTSLKRNIFFIAVAILIIFGLLPQNSVAQSKRVKSIDKIVEKIKSNTGYVIKELHNDYFVNKNEATDGGQEVKGFYKDGQVKRINYSVGLSNCMRRFEYYFSDNQLVFVSEKTEYYTQLKGSGEFARYESSTLTGNYYFPNDKKLFKFTLTAEEEKSILEDVQWLIKELTEAKNN